jgi:adenylate cyclase
MDPASDRSPPFTLFITVLSLFLFVALLVGTAEAITSYVQARKTATKVASDTFDTTIDRINERRLAFFASAFLITEQLRNEPLFHQAAGSKETIRPLILSNLTLSPRYRRYMSATRTGITFRFCRSRKPRNPL